MRTITVELNWFVPASVGTAVKSFLKTRTIPKFPKVRDFKFSRPRVTKFKTVFDSFYEMTVVALVEGVHRPEVPGFTQSQSTVCQQENTADNKIVRKQH